MNIAIDYIRELATKMYDDFDIPYQKSDEDNLWIFFKNKYNIQNDMIVKNIFIGCYEQIYNKK